ncbi:MAG: protein kinase, partial [Blastocatellia bacterium]|nr:protein kinase [Blastocatellia bacterium]
MIAKNISHYSILEQIGSGVISDVFKAFDQAQNRTVILKLLRTQYTSDEGKRQRFLQEARAASLLNHPNIIKIYDIGREG